MTLGIKLPESWKLVPFGELSAHSAFGPRFSSKDYADDGDIATLRTTDIFDDGRISYETMPLAKLDGQFAKHFLQKGDLVITRSGTCGIAAVFTGYKMPVLPGAFLIRFRLHLTTCNPFYYRYFFNSPVGRGHVLSTATGAVQQNLNITNLENLKVPFPPVAVQNRIVAVLSSYDDLIENNTRRITILEEMAQTIYREWFVEFRFPGHENVKLINSPLGKIPDGWKRPFSDYVDFLEGPGLRRWQYREEGIPFLNIRTIGNNDIDLSKCQFVDPAEVEQKYSHFLLRPLDHVVSSSGTIGRIATVQQHHLPLMLNTSIIRMAPKNEAVGRWQLKHFLQSPYFQDQIVAHASGVAQMNYGPSHLKLMWIIAPDEATGIAYEQHVEPMESLLCSLVKKNTNLRTTRDLLLPKLISGQLDVEDLDIDTGESAVADASGSDLVCSDAVSEGAERSEPQASTPTRKKQS